jgi:hypothetical protein
MKFGEDLDIGIKDYVGRIGPGVTIILSVIYKAKLYEAMYWYTDTDNLLQFPIEIEEDLGCVVEDYVRYNEIMEFLSEEKSNYKETAPELDDIFESNPDQNQEEK